MPQGAQQVQHPIKGGTKEKMFRGFAFPNTTRGELRLRGVTVAGAVVEAATERALVINSFIVTGRLLSEAMKIIFRSSSTETPPAQRIPTNDGEAQEARFRKL